MYNFSVVVVLGRRTLEFVRQGVDSNDVVDWANKHFPGAYIQVFSML